MKFKCCMCDKMAVWYYEPWSENKIEANCYYCDDCISRGCSCNINPESREEDRDIHGRLLPCIEYIYCENGYGKN